MTAIRFAVITLSDRAAAGTREDASGPIACALLEERLGVAPVAAVVLPDERGALEELLIQFADDQRLDLVVTTGGTGFAPRDITPEATRAVIEREAPGLAEAMRAAGLAHTPHAMLSRAVCGLRGATLIVNCSGSPKAVREQLEAILPVLPHAIATARGHAVECASMRAPSAPS